MYLGFTEMCKNEPYGSNVPELVRNRSGKQSQSNCARYDYLFVRMTNDLSLWLLSRPNDERSLVMTPYSSEWRTIFFLLRDSSLKKSTLRLVDVYIIVDSGRYSGGTLKVLSPWFCLCDYEYPEWQGTYYFKKQKMSTRSRKDFMIFPIELLKKWKFIPF